MEICRQICGEDFTILLSESAVVTSGFHTKIATEPNGLVLATNPSFLLVDREKAKAHRVSVSQLTRATLLF